MRNGRTSSLRLVATAFLIAVVGCDSSDQIQGVVTPSFSSSEHSWSLPVSELVLYQSRVATQSASAIMGQSGGRLSVAKHILDVPRRAVSENTLFTMTVVGGDTVH